VRLLGLFRDTLYTLSEAHETGEDAIDLLDRRIGWHQLLRAMTDVEAVSTTADPDPLSLGS
jgi:hypothetical protein